MTPNARLSLTLDRAVHIVKTGRSLSDMTDMEVAELANVFNNEHLARIMKPQPTALKAGDTFVADFGEPFTEEELG